MVELENGQQTMQDLGIESVSFVPVRTARRFSLMITRFTTRKGLKTFFVFLVTFLGSFSCWRMWFADVGA